MVGIASLRGDSGWNGNAWRALARLCASGWKSWDSKSLCVGPVGIVVGVQGTGMAHLAPEGDGAVEAPDGRERGPRECPAYTCTRLVCVGMDLRVEGALLLGHLACWHGLLRGDAVSSQQGFGSGVGSLTPWGFLRNLSAYYHSFQQAEGGQSLPFCWAICFLSCFISLDFLGRGSYLEYISFLLFLSFLSFTRAPG